MTARTSPTRRPTHIDRVRVDFSRLDQAAAVARICRLRDSGFEEAEIVARSSWSLIDVRRALGSRQ